MMQLARHIPAFSAIKAERVRPAAKPALVIAIINNVSDQGLQATERQYFRLLDTASAGRPVQLKFVSLPGVIRSPETQAHVDRYYEPLSSLLEDPPDGLIVTGAEPSANCLTKEAFWPAFTCLVDWAESLSIPGIWSCLAAQGAVLRMDGIARHRLPGKLSGVYACQVNSESMPLAECLPQRWHMPHSRFYDIRARDLRANGYRVVSWSDEAGVDIFVKPGRTFQFFFQSHPEYEPATLLGEYRRDVARFLNGQFKSYPEFPRHYGDKAAASRFAECRRRVADTPGSAFLAEFRQIPFSVDRVTDWSTAAYRVYRNWLSYLWVRRSLRPASVMPSLRCQAG